VEKALSNQLNQEEDSQKDQFLTFMLCDECYGIAIEHVKELIGMQSITELPELPEYIRGIINLRGKIIPVMDVRLRFKRSFREYNDRTCVIVCEMKGIAVGFIVDAVAEVLAIPETEIVAPPELNQAVNRYIKGIGKVDKGVVLLLDCDQLLKEEPVSAIAHSEPIDPSRVGDYLN
jgi:purine-binding chemotaxis protein CheW